MKNKTNKINCEKMQNINSNSYTLFLKTLSESIEFIKIKNISESLSQLIMSESHAKNLIKEVILKNTLNSNNQILFYVVSKNLIEYLNFFINLNTYVLQENILMSIKSKIYNILNVILLEEKYYQYICEQSLILDFIKLCVELINSNKNTKLIYQFIIKKIEKYIIYVVNKEGNIKELLGIKDKILSYHSNKFKNYKNELLNMNIINLMKSDEKEDKKLSLNKLSSFFNEIFLFTEKYEILYLISKEIFPFLISDIIKDNIDLYIQFGHFLLTFLFYENYFIGNNSSTNNKIKKFPYFFLYNNKEIQNLNELKSKKYKIYLKYDILKIFNKEIIEIMINYFIEPFKILDLNFEVQYILYNILKNLYFIYPDERESFSKYIPTVLNNLCSFKSKEYWNRTLSSRQFGYYLLVNDKELNPLINSITNAFENEEEIYSIKLDLNNIIINNEIFKKIRIDDKYEIIFEMEKKYSFFYLEFYVENNDSIDINVYKINYENNKNNFQEIGKINEVETLKDDNEKITNAKLIIINDKENKESNTPRKFKVVFDNSNALLGSKEIYFSYSIFEII